MRKRLLFVLPLCAVAIMSAPVGAKSDKAKSDKAKSPSVEAAEGLRQMGDALHKIQRAAAELVGEATRQDYVAVGDPDVVGTIIIPAIPEPSGVMAVGPYLPMRKAWVDYYLDQVGHLLPVYARETDALVLPDDAKTAGVAILDTMRPLFADAKDHYMTLLQMAVDLKDADNTKLGEQATMLHDDMKKMDDIRKNVFKLLKEDKKKDDKKDGKSS